MHLCHGYIKSRLKYLDVEHWGLVLFVKHWERGLGSLSVSSLLCACAPCVWRLRQITGSSTKPDTPWSKVCSKLPCVCEKDSVYDRERVSAILPEEECTPEERSSPSKHFNSIAKMCGPQSRCSDSLEDLPWGVWAQFISSLISGLAHNVCQSVVLDVVVSKSWDSASYFK